MGSIIIIVHIKHLYRGSKEAKEIVNVAVGDWENSFQRVREIV